MLKLMLLVLVLGSGRESPRRERSIYSYSGQPNASECLCWSQCRATSATSRAIHAAAAVSASASS
eukprot:2304445-Amphidinium_carterae.1